MNGAGVAGLMCRVSDVAMVRIMMRLGLDAGEAKGRSRNRCGRRQAGKPTHSRATVTQRHGTPRRNRAIVRPGCRSQLRYAHARQRYAAAVTQRLTGFRRLLDIFSKPLESLSADETGAVAG